VKTALFSSLLLFHAGMAYAGETSKTDIPLSLVDAIQIALTHNPDIQLEKETISLREAALLRESARFNSTLQGRANQQRLARSSTSRLETGLPIATILKQDDLDLSLEWKRPFIWGGEYSLGLRELRTDATFQAENPTYRSDLFLKITQPLLKGFGKTIRQGPLTIAKTEVDVAHHLLRARVTDILLKVMTLYWELFFQRENLLIQQDSLERANQLLSLNQAKVDLGLLAPIEILVAKSSIASREEAVLVAQKGMEDADDQLKQLLHQDETPGSGLLFPTDTPTGAAVDFNAKDLLPLVLQKRPEIEAARLQAQNKGLSVQVAENQLRPSLDLVGAIGPSGTGQTLSRSLDPLFSSGDFYRWEAGLLLTYPIGNGAAVASLAMEKAEHRIREIERDRWIGQVALEVREGDRRVRTDFKRVQTAQHAQALAHKQYAAQEERFRLGFLASHDLIEFQNEVAASSVNAVRAITDYNIALARLDRATGMLLQNYQISITPQIP
jgi:outer membrane protein TolC